MEINPDSTAPEFCSFLRRLTVIFYDTLLLLPVFFVATLGLMPFLDTNTIDSGNTFYKIFLILLAYLYFVWQWTHSGQTLGMRAWHVRLTGTGTIQIDWSRATIRFVTAILSWMILGLGFIWSVIDKNKMTLHDHITQTVLIIDR
jgi:uncharacterized RDD family membrane protein YckC